MPEFVLFDKSTNEILFRREAKDAYEFFENIKYDLRRMALRSPRFFSLASELVVAQVTPGLTLKPAELSKAMKNIVETKLTLLEEAEDRR